MLSGCGPGRAVETSLAPDSNLPLQSFSPKPEYPVEITKEEMKQIKADYKAGVAAPPPVILQVPPAQGPSPSPAPGLPAVPEEPPRYSSKPNFNIVRVRLFPIFKRDTPYLDPFVPNALERKLTLKNDQGLQLIAINSKKVIASGTKVTFDLSLGVILVDGVKKSALAKVEVLPVLRGSGTVLIGLKESSTSTDGYFKFEGSFSFLKTTVVNASGSPVNTWHLVNFVYLEDYIMAVAHSEIPLKWMDPAENAGEAVKAQAIAARSYALNIIANSRRASTREWDVLPTTANQAYFGIRFLNENGRALISATAGQVATFEDKIILAAFSANSGGQTCSALDCWGTDLPYLDTVPDVPEVRTLPGGSRQAKISRVDFQQALKKNRIIVNGNSPAQKISIFKANSSLRVKQITAVVADKVFNLNTDQTDNVLTSLNIGSRFLEFSELENDEFTISSFGFGHGIGMSQWGAYAQSRSGISAEKIIQFYYRDIKIDTLAE